VRSVVVLERRRGESEGLDTTHGGINTNGFKHLELFLPVSRRLDAAVRERVPGDNVTRYITMSLRDLHAAFAQLTGGRACLTLGKGRSWRDSCEGLWGMV
jgi:hypothetical protein